MTNLTIIDELYADHHTMRQMFFVIDAEMTNFMESRVPDFEIMLAAVEYCHAFPGAKHHPIEDILFRFLKERDDAAAQVMGDLQAEHEILGDYTRRFKSAIERVLNEEIVSKEELTQLSEDYVQFLRRHMHTEETQFFPAVSKTLTRADWSAIRAEVDGFKQTELSPELEGRFERLRKITSEHLRV